MKLAIYLKFLHGQNNDLQIHSRNKMPEIQLFKEICMHEKNIVHVNCDCVLHNNFIIYGLSQE